VIDHTGFTVSDLKKSKAFYAEALRSLGIKLLMEVTAEQTGAGGATRHIFGSAITAVRVDRCTSRSWLTLEPRSMRFTKRRSRPAARTMVRPGYALTIMRITTVRSLSIQTATTSRRFATRPLDAALSANQFQSADSA
jgi:hypothetical protein